MKQLYKTALLAITCTLSFNINAGSKPNTQEGLRAKASNDINFTENKGQVCDQNYKPRPDVLYSGTDGQLVFHLKNNGISYQLNRIDSWKKRENISHRKTPTELKDTSLVPDQSTIYRLDINWLNANTKAAITKGDALEGYNNYYLEQCPNGALNVKSYSDVTYQNIYIGIDLKWYQKDGHLKYDYLVAAGADYKQIQLQIRGAEKISINSKGDLVLKTPLGEIIEQAPMVMQAGRTLKSKWKIEDGKICYEIENLNPNQDFVIDPGIRVWGTYYGGSGSDYAYSCATNSLGDVYLAGYTSTFSATLIATVGAYQTTLAGSQDAFLVKFDANGVRQWGTYYGGTSTDYAYACSANASGDVYLAGYTFGGSGTVIATTGAHQTAFGGSLDAFLVKFNSAGVRQWGTFYGGTNNEYAYSCATNTLGDVYLAGFSSSGTGTIVATTGSHQMTLGGGADAFLVKFNTNGVRQWGTYYGGTGTDIGNSCAVSSTGDVYLAGETDSGTGTVIATTGAHQFTFAGGGTDAFVASFNSNGVRQWGTYYGDVYNDRAYSCATDLSGNVFLAGENGGGSPTSTVLATSGAYQQVNAGNLKDAFLVKFNSSGTRQWGTYYGDSYNQVAYSCATDISGNVYIAGTTSGFAPTNTLLATSGSYQTATGGTLGASDAFLAKFTSTGLRDWGTYYGDADTESGRSCATNTLGEVFMAGQTISGVTSTILATTGAHQSSLGGVGTNDAFLVKFFDCTIPSTPTNVTAASNQTICATVPTTLMATGSGTISWYSSLTSSIALSTGTVFITPTLSAGNYTYYAEAFTCLSSFSRTAITLTVNPIPILTVNSGSICTGQSFTMVPSGANTYTFSNGNAVVNPLTNASYTVTGTSAAGCVSGIAVVSSVTVNITPSISVNNGTICSGQIFTIIPSGANTYSYSSGASTVAPGTTTSYVVTGISAQGCLNTATSNILVNISPTIAVNSGTLCAGSAFTMTPTGAFSYNYSSGSAVVSPLSNTLYFVTGTSAQGCVGTNTAISTITVYTSPAISVNSGSICSGSSFTMNPTGATNYTFSSGNAVVTPVTTSAYTVSSSNTLGCVGIAVSTITVNSLPTLATASTSSLLCEGETATLSVSGANTYSWSTGASANSITVSPTSAANYSVTGINANGCSKTEIVTQNVSPCTSISQLYPDSYLGLNSQLSIYPNPNTGEFTIETPVETEVTIVNALGQLILQKHLAEGKNKIEISQQAKGVYFVKTKNGNYKIIKE